MVSFECPIKVLYYFLKSMYGRRFNSGGTDSQIFIAENLNVDIPSLVRTDGLKKF